MAIYRSIAELETGLAVVLRAPKDEGTLDLIVRRPGVGEREVLHAGTLSFDEGLVGDTWKLRPSRHTPDGSPHPDEQLNVMGARAIALIAVERSRWALAGDQLYVDFDLSADNAPPGTRLAIGDVVIEITDRPHLGCSKFAERFGNDALKFVNAPAFRMLNLRGVNARVVSAGAIRVGDRVVKAIVKRPATT